MGGERDRIVFDYGLREGRAVILVVVVLLIVTM